MKKKVLIGILILIILIVAIIAIFIVKKNKTEKPEDVWSQYISYINEQKYEEMYNMLTENSRQNISQEDFIKRNKNIYEGIDMEDLKINISNIENEDKKTVKISYNNIMETSAGNIDFDNIVRLTKNDKKEYKINWSSSLIFPELGNNDKVRVKTVTASRGTIYDRNGKVLAGEGEIL